jgi:hypothetical protein
MDGFIQTRTLAVGPYASGPWHAIAIERQNSELAHPVAGGIPASAVLRMATSGNAELMIGRNRPKDDT